MEQLPCQGPSNLQFLLIVSNLESTPGFSAHGQPDFDCLFSSSYDALRHLLPQTETRMCQFAAGQFVTNCDFGLGCLSKTGPSN
jgi:hypothetical protein